MKLRAHGVMGEGGGWGNLGKDLTGSGGDRGEGCGGGEEGSAGRLGGIWVHKSSLPVQNV
jgi:hypothetical protein